MELYKKILKDFDYPTQNVAEISTTYQTKLSSNERKELQQLLGNNFKISTNFMKTKLIVTKIFKE